MPYRPEHDEVANPLRKGLRAKRTPGPCAVVIFGASGDLTMRKLFPALFALEALGELPGGFAVVGCANTPMASEEWRAKMREALSKHGRVKPESTPDGEALWERFAAGVHYVSGDFSDPRCFEKLKTVLEEVDRARGTRGNRLFYCATPPSAFPALLEGLKSAGMIAPPYSDNTTSVVIEKPFGRDAPSARALNELVHTVLDESQVFRIDHYLGKETVQNLLVFRFGNAIFEPVWNRAYIDHVQITAAEELGVERRGRYYDSAGVLRDMIQNHVLQLVTLTAMEPPVAFDADAMRDEKVKVLRAVRTNAEFVLGQYSAGAIGTSDVPAYRDEPDVAKDSRTETFAALKLYIDNWRWGGVPFYIRSGKRLPKRTTEIAVVFRPVAHALFGSSATQQNVLSVRVQPDEGISIRFNAKVPGESYRPRAVNMDFSYGAAFGGQAPEAYERLLLDALRGDQTLFTRSDEVQAAWRIVGDVLTSSAEKEPAPYESGSWGPREAHEMLARDGRRWRRL